MVQRPVVVVQTEQQRTDQYVLPGFVPSKPGRHAIGGARVLHLDHGALAGFVRPELRLRDHAVEAGSLEARQPL